MHVQIVAPRVARGRVAHIIARVVHRHPLGPHLSIAARRSCDCCCCCCCCCGGCAAARWCELIGDAGCVGRPEELVLAVELIGLLGGEENDAGKDVRGRHVAAAEYKLEYGADLLVRFVVARYRTPARVQTAAEAAENGSQACVQNVALLGDVNFAEVRDGIEDDEEHNEEEEDAERAKGAIGHDAPRADGRARRRTPAAHDEPRDADAAGGHLTQHEHHAHVDGERHVASRCVVGDRAQRADDHNDELGANDGQHCGEEALEVEVEQLEALAFVMGRRERLVEQVLKELRKRPHRSHEQLDQIRIEQVIRGLTKR